MARRGFGTSAVVGMGVACGLLACDAGLGKAVGDRDPVRPESDDMGSETDVDEGPSVGKPVVRPQAPSPGVSPRVPTAVPTDAVPSASVVEPVADPLSDGGAAPASTSDAGVTPNPTSPSPGSGMGEPPATPLVLVAISPAPFAEGVAPNVDLQLGFDRPVSVGQGDVNVVSAAGNTLFERIPVDDSRVEFEGARVTIDLSQDLLPNTEYGVSVDRGAFVDAAGVAFGGVGVTEWMFTTAGALDGGCVANCVPPDASGSVSGMEPARDAQRSGNAPPSSLPVSDCVLWLDATVGDSIQLLEGQVARWNDISSSGSEFAQSTAAARPTLVESCIASEPCIRFDGVNDVLVGPDLAEPDSYDLFVVWQVRVAPSGTTAVLLSNADQTDFNLQLNVDHSWDERRTAAIAEFEDAVRRSAPFAPLKVNEPTLWNVAFDLDAGGWRTFTNGALTSSDTAMDGVPDTTSQSFTLGARANGSWPASADVGELLYCDRQLSDAERSEVTDYLSSKWNVSVP